MPLPIVPITRSRRSRQAPASSLAILLFLPVYASGQAAPTAPRLDEFYSAVLDSVGVRTNEFRGWPDGSIRLRIDNTVAADSPVLDGPTLDVLRGRDDVVGICTDFGAPCTGGDYVMRTRFRYPEMASDGTATILVHLAGDDGARGDPDSAFAIAWEVTVVRAARWTVRGISLRFVTAP